MTEPAVEQKTLPTLTSLRAVAALLVFAFHASRVGGGPLAAFRDGYAGVAFFFVLSGFVLTWSYAVVRAPSHFYWRRFARVYPLHLVTALLVGVLIGFPALPKAALNLLLLQGWVPQADVAFSLNAPSWSLSCEAFFYLTFPMLAARLIGMARGSRWLVAGGLWVLCSVVAVGLEQIGTTTSNIASFTLPPVRVGEFVLGIALALALRAGDRPPVRSGSAALVVVVALVVNRALPIPSPLSDVTLALPFALLIWACAAGDADGRPLLPWRWAVFAGEVSFAFYLVHERTLAEVSQRIGSRQVAVVAAFVISAGLAVAAHLLVEKPARQWLTRSRGTLTTSTSGMTRSR